MAQAATKLTPHSYIVTIDIDSYGQLNFNNVQEVLDWLVAEKNFWNWATKNWPGDLGILDHSRRDQFFGWLSTAINEFQKYFQNDADQNALQMAKKAIQMYADYGLASDTPRAQFIHGLRALPHGDVVAHSALATYLGESQLKNLNSQPPDYRYPSFRGRIQMALFDEGVARDSMDQARKAIKSIGQSNTRALGELKAANETALAALLAAVEDARAQNTRDAEVRATQIDVALKDFASDKDAITKQCDEAHARYTTAMEIQGPVDYWTAKYKEHKKAARVWGAILVGYAVAGCVAIAFILHFAYTYALAATEQVYSHVTLVFSASIALSVTVLFWIARFLSRLYLSERHMAIDAKLRAVMAKTYLALASNQQVKDSDRALVLAPLFRAGTDGIIKEETGLDSALAMVARALEKPSK
jgi:hypothetical protein